MSHIRESHPSDGRRYHSRVGTRPLNSNKPSPKETLHVAIWDVDDYKEIVDCLYRKVFEEDHEPYRWDEASLQKVEKHGRMYVRESRTSTTSE